MCLTISPAVRRTPGSMINAKYSRWIGRMDEPVDESQHFLVPYETVAKNDGMCSQ